MHYLNYKDDPDPVHECVELLKVVRVFRHSSLVTACSGLQWFKLTYKFVYILVNNLENITWRYKQK